MPARLDREAVVGRDIGNPAGQYFDILFARQSESDVFCDRQRIEERKMLEHHADAEFLRVGR